MPNNPSLEKIKSLIEKRNSNFEKQRKLYENIMIYSADIAALRDFIAEQEADSDYNTHERNASKRQDIYTCFVSAAALGWKYDDTDYHVIAKHAYDPDGQLAAVNRILDRHVGSGDEHVKARARAIGIVHAGNMKHQMAAYEDGLLERDYYGRDHFDLLADHLNSTNPLRAKKLQSARSRGKFNVEQQLRHSIAGSDDIRGLPKPFDIGSAKALHDLTAQLKTVFIPEFIERCKQEIGSGINALENDRSSRLAIATNVQNNCIEGVGEQKSKLTELTRENPDESVSEIIKNEIRHFMKAYDYSFIRPQVREKPVPLAAGSSLVQEQGAGSTGPSADQNASGRPRTASVTGLDPSGPDAQRRRLNADAQPVDPRNENPGLQPRDTDRDRDVAPNSR